MINPIERETFSEILGRLYSLIMQHNTVHISVIIGQSLLNLSL